MILQPALEAVCSICIVIRGLVNLLGYDMASSNIDNEPTKLIGWQDGTDELEIVWKRLPAIPDACNLLAADAI